VKKLIVLVAVVVSLGLWPWHAAHASTLDQVIIDGVVTHNGAPAAGFAVAVSCHDKLWANFIGFATANASGYYKIITTTDECPFGSTAESRADQNNDGKYESSAESTVKPHTIVNIQLGKNFVVPEYSVLTGMLALATGFGALCAVRYVVTRRT
jgi:hypothetical protein